MGTGNGGLTENWPALEPRSKGREVRPPRPDVQRGLQFEPARCRARGVLIDTKGGERVSLSMFHAKLTPTERARWFRSSAISERPDQFGYLPADFEMFLESLEG